MKFITIDNEYFDVCRAERILIQKAIKSYNVSVWFISGSFQSYTAVSEDKVLEIKNAMNYYTDKQLEEIKSYGVVKK